jgi:hypothetical protein
MLDAGWSSSGTAKSTCSIPIEMVALHQTGRIWYAKHGLSNSAPQISKTYPLPKVVGPLNFMDENCNRGKTSGIWSG